MNVHCHYLPMTSVMEGCSRADVLPFPKGRRGREKPIQKSFLHSEGYITSERKKLF